MVLKRYEDFSELEKMKGADTYYDKISTKKYAFYICVRRCAFFAHSILTLAIVEEK